MTAIATSNATPVHGSAINLTVSAAPANTATGYQTTTYPHSPAILYYITLDKTGADSLTSPRFTPDSVNGAYVWAGVVVPSAGSWTANLRLDATGVSQANVAVTAS